MQPKEEDRVQEATQVHNSLVGLPQLMINTAQPEVQLQAAMVLNTMVCEPAAFLESGLQSCLHSSMYVANLLEVQRAQL